MQKPVRLLASIAVAAMFLGGVATYAEPLGEPAYATRYYSDATYQTQVGTEAPTCTYRGVIYNRVGTVTAYSDTELVFYCNDGVAVQP